MAIRVCTSPPPVVVHHPRPKVVVMPGYGYGPAHVGYAPPTRMYRPDRARWDRHDRHLRDGASTMGDVGEPVGVGLENRKWVRGDAGMLDLGGIGDIRPHQFREETAEGDTDEPRSVQGQARRKIARNDDDSLVGIGIQGFGHSAKS